MRQNEAKSPRLGAYPAIERPVEPFVRQNKLRPLSPIPLRSALTIFPFSPCRAGASDVASRIGAGGYRTLAELRSAGLPGLLRSGPSQRFLRPRRARTCLRRAPSPTPVRGWTGPPGAACRCRILKEKSESADPPLMFSQRNNPYCEWLIFSMTNIKTLFWKNNYYI